MTEQRVLWWIWAVSMLMVVVLALWGCSDGHPTASTTRVCVDHPVDATVASECH